MGSISGTKRTMKWILFMIFCYGTVVVDASGCRVRGHLYWERCSCCTFLLSLALLLCYVSAAAHCGARPHYWCIDYILFAPIYFKYLYKFFEVIWGQAAIHRMGIFAIALTSHLVRALTRHLGYFIRRMNTYKAIFSNLFLNLVVDVRVSPLYNVAFVDEIWWSLKECFTEHYFFNRTSPIISFVGVGRYI